MQNNPNEKIISEIHLIRHGNTEGTEKKWMYGGIDIPLSPAGVDQLAELTKKGIYPCQDIAESTEPDENGEIAAPDFYTSGMLRAEQTLFIIYGGVPHGTIPELKELRFGIFEGKSHDELKGNPIYDAWISVEDENAAPPQGESFRAFRDRVSAGWDKLFGYHQIKELSHRHSKLPAHSVIACHGGVIGCLMMQLFPEKDLNMYGWIPDPGHGYSIIIEDGRAVGYRGF
jgi:alpha-ribazole phosphatase